LQSLYIGKEVKGSFALTPKKIEIELAYPVGGPIRRLNITKLIKFFLSKSDLQCTFLNKFGPMTELDQLFWGHSKTWKDAIEQDLHGVMLWPPNGSKTTVELVFRSDAKQNFIEDVPSRRWKYAPPSLYQYLTEIGATGLGAWGARVDVLNTSTRVEFVVSKTQQAPKKDIEIREKNF